MVYSLPDPSQAQTEISAPSGRGKLLIVVLLCVLPMLVSFLAYRYVRLGGHATGGELIHPAQPMPEISLPGKDGKPILLNSLKGQWLLVGVGDTACVDDCAQRVFLQRQLRETLGKDRDRVDRVLVAQGAGELAAPLRAQSGDLVILQDDAGQLMPWLNVPPGQSAKDYQFLVDPLGNLMMRFPAKFDSAGAAKIRRDLERLLRASVAWDGPGR